MCFLTMKIALLVSVLTILIDTNLVIAQHGDSSFDSLIASQCRARCLSLYPWSQPSSSYQALRYFQKRHSASITDIRIEQRSSGSRTHRQYNNRNQRGHNRWKKIMEKCSKNENCLQCTLPCDIPTNLLSNCKYLCKNNNQLCQDSCDLRSKLNQEKYGSCPSFVSQPAKTIQYLISAKGQLSESNTLTNKCTEQSKSSAVVQLLQNNGEKEINQCGQDSECGETKKCCSLNPTCPQYGSFCAKPVINNKNISSAPFNLTIIERKKGKTIILKWDCIYKHNQPTVFVVEGRWSLKSPNIGESDHQMTKWGYLAQTLNNNWIILRNINRGRWYKFRVSSVTKHGSLGYSKPTSLFILSSAPNPPSQPQNLTTTSIYSIDNEMKADFSWLPSRRSDLPISHYRLSWQQENSISPHFGYDIISNSNTYTVNNLLPDTTYLIELRAVAIYEGKELKSKPIIVQIKTNRAENNLAHSSYLVSEPINANEEYTDDVEEDEDIENEYETLFHATKNVQNRIHNLTAQEPYFRNGLVKAKLSWQFSDTTSTDNSVNSASINSIVIEPAMFTITWFPIKCHESDNSPIEKSTLPTPITATTINTHFEIYELKYNCDYVINVRNNKASSGVSSSLNPTPPHIASAQFKVPSCDDVEIIGQIKPRCLKLLSSVLSTRPTAPQNILPRFTSTRTTHKPTTTTNQPPLPRVYNIRHRIVGHSGEFYSVEFTWSLPEYFHATQRFNGYQISVVPKAIPGFGTPDDLVSFGSVGAIVDRDQSSFVVKQLRQSVKYIFQIQLIALDNQSYGPASSLEFKINGGEYRKTTVLNRYYSEYENYDRNGYGFGSYLRTTTERSVESGSGGLMSLMNWFSLMVLVLSVRSLSELYL